MKMKGADALTGLPDREALRADLAVLMAAAENVALAVLDIDYFETINRDFGSETGDQVLQGAAALLSSEGTAFRLSGDEFAILLPGLTLEQAFLKMEGL